LTKKIHMGVSKMEKNILEITKVEELSGVNFYTVVANDEHTEVVAEETLIDFIQAGFSFVVDEENEQFDELGYIELEYMEVALDLDGSDAVDVYRHRFEIKSGEVYSSMNMWEKEYKQYKSALKYAEKQNTLRVAESK